MKRWIQAFAMILALASAAWAAPLPTLTALRQIHLLDNEEGDKGYPVNFEATVTYVRAWDRVMFVQDGDLAIFILVPTDASSIVAGDRVRIQGKTAGSYNPIVLPAEITVLRHGPLPMPIPATYAQLVKTELDCKYVSIRGVVRSADVVRALSSEKSAQLEVQTDSGTVEMYLDTSDAVYLRNLLDTTVEVSGASAGKFDDKMQLVGTVLYIPRLENVKVLLRPAVNPWSKPITPMDKTLQVYNLRDLSPRVRIQGSITYYQPGIAVVLQDGTKSLWIDTSTIDPLRIGDRADVIGYTTAHGRTLSLIDAEVQDNHAYAPIRPQLATARQLAIWSPNQPGGHINDLVSVEGTVEAEVREDLQDEYILSSKGRLFTAICHHPSASGPIAPMQRIPQGTRIRVTGICTRIETKIILPGSEVPFNILMRSVDDIAILAKPPLINKSNLILAISLLLMIVIGVSVWGWTLRKKVRQQTKALSTMAQFEQRRSYILEKINGSDQLADVLDEITSLVSSMLNEVNCWCDVKGGAALGVSPPRQHSDRAQSAWILDRSGTPIGSILVEMTTETSSLNRTMKALEIGARLASLAIETRRLYTDMRRRSEYDLLTEIPNRFAMDKFLDVRIEESIQTSNPFGLIYIDLDKFKPINDRYGHHIGDLFLQEVALRMQKQLRSCDMLARLGGDEFAAVVSVARNRTELEEVVKRLQSCFQTPFVIEGYILHGDASFGSALYPVDGTTKDNLLCAADAVMYAMKKERRKRDSLAEPATAEVDLKATT